MAWSYNAAGFDDQVAGTYASSTRGVRWQLRFLIQDTNSAKVLMQDEELDWLQTLESNVYNMAARACEALLAKFQGLSSKRISQLQVTFDPKIYRILAMDFRARGASNQVPYAGGISIADKNAQRSDPDWVAPAISRGLHDHPTAPQTEVGRPDSFKPI